MSEIVPGKLKAARVPAADWRFGAWPSVEPNDWAPATRGSHPDDNIDFHVDLGCGRVKKGRIGVDRYRAEGVDVVLNLNQGWLPFPDNSIESIVSHHALEHIGDGFIPLIDECYRVLKPGAPLRVIVPLFPSVSAVADPDHCRYFMEDTWLSFCGTPGDTPQNCWLASFSVPYTSSRFELTAADHTPLFPPEQRWTAVDRRESRVTLRAMK